MTRILIVEDERNLALGLRANLEVEQYEVVVAATGEAAIESLNANVPDLVVLDLTLPGIDGYEVLARIRAKGLEVPVLILSARAEEIDKVRGFRLGADDYVTKPFGVMELVLRIKALVRRSGRPATQSRGQWLLGDVEVDASRRIVKRGSEEVALTPRASCSRLCSRTRSQSCLDTTCSRRYGVMTNPSRHEQSTRTSPS